MIQFTPGIADIHSDPPLTAISTRCIQTKTRAENRPASGWSMSATRWVSWAMKWAVWRGVEAQDSPKRVPRWLMATAQSVVAPCEMATTRLNSIYNLRM